MIQQGLRIDNVSKLSKLIYNASLPTLKYMGVFIYPYLLLGFWLKDVSFGSVVLSKNILIYWLNLLSVPLLIKSFFKPLKNEYRDGLVLFSVLMGIIVKTILLVAIFCLTLILVCALVVFILLVSLVPLFIVRMLAW